MMSKISIFTQKLTKHKNFSYRNLSNILTAPKYDLVVVGGGIVGTATARELMIRNPKFKMAIVEKEDSLGAHQSGHNSGVVHAGIYYQPGSLKAKLCVSGMQLAYQYFDQHQIPYKKCGKLIVAVDASEVPSLENLYKRGLENKVEDLKMVDFKGIQEIEPNCRGVKAVWSPHTGIVDWSEVNKSFGNDFRSKGGHLHLNFHVKSLSYSPADSQYPLQVKSKDHVPNPKFPFLGVHFTPRMDGSVWLGPNAVLAFKKEGYKATDISLSEMYQILKYRGLQRLASKNFRYGLNEMYLGCNISAQVKQLQRFVPQLKVQDVTRGPSGVRAQALDRDGNLVDDFVFDVGQGPLSKRILHVRNAPSPGATSSLAIAIMIADKANTIFTLDGHV